jgi:hypothetical protein
MIEDNEGTAEYRAWIKELKIRNCFKTSSSRKSYKLEMIKI